MVQDKSHVMYDMVYYWPMYTNTSVMMSEVCSLKLSSCYVSRLALRYGPCYLRLCNVYINYGLMATCKPKISLATFTGAFHCGYIFNANALDFTSYINHRRWIYGEGG